jgi:fructose-specific phosphotransferase system IIC component
MKAFLIIILSTCGACSQINRINVGSMIVANTTLAVDWHQTHYMAQHADHYAEANPMLGAHPSSTLVAGYFAGWIVATTAAHWVLPRWAQPIAYGALIGLELSTIRDNVRSEDGWK